MVFSLLLAAGLSVSSAQSIDMRGVYVIQNQGSQKCLDVADRNPNNGANLQQWDCVDGDAQKFVLEQSPLSRWPSDVVIKSRLSGRCLDVAARSVDNGANIQTWDCSDTTNQTFKMVTQQNTPGGLLGFQSANGGRCLDVAGRSVDNGANLQQWDCVLGPNQLFRLVQVGWQD